MKRTKQHQLCYEKMKKRILFPTIPPESLPAVVGCPSEKASGVDTALGVMTDIVLTCLSWPGWAA